MVRNNLQTFGDQESGDDDVRLVVAVTVQEEFPHYLHAYWTYLKFLMIIGCILFTTYFIGRVEAVTYPYLRDVDELRDASDSSMQSTQTTQQSAVASTSTPTPQTTAPSAH